jgi:hypothetical protein
MQEINADFTKKNYINILNLIKEYVIDFHTPGPGIILRHDIDDDFERSVRMAHIEETNKVKSTYFVLNTAEYWDDPEIFNLLMLMQAAGHGIGWHNNALIESLDKGKDLRRCISDPLEKMRGCGLLISGSAGHGDNLCYKYNVLNYNIFGFSRKGWDGYNGEIFDMKDFGLEYEASHAGHEGYLSDSGGKWSIDPVETLNKWIIEKKRYQILIHPQWWSI